MEYRSREKSLMWLTVAQDLEDKTRRFWRVSSIWNGKIDVEMPACDAIEHCNSNLLHTNPGRQIARSTEVLLSELIKGSGSPRPSETKIIELPSCLDVQLPFSTSGC